MLDDEEREDELEPRRPDCDSPKRLAGGGLRGGSSADFEGRRVGSHLLIDEAVEVDEA